MAIMGNSSTTNHDTLFRNPKSLSAISANQMVTTQGMNACMGAPFFFGLNFRVTPEYNHMEAVSVCKVKAAYSG